MSSERILSHSHYFTLLVPVRLNCDMRTMEPSSKPGHVLLRSDHNSCRYSRVSDSYPLKRNFFCMEHLTNGPIILSYQCVAFDQNGKDEFNLVTVECLLLVPCWVCPLVTTTWRVLGLQKEGTASSFGGQLPIH